MLATAGKFGIGFTPNDRNVYNKSGTTVAVGDVLVFDTRWAGGSTNSVYGDEASHWSNVVVNSALQEHMRGGVCCVVTQLGAGRGAHGSRITVRITGKVTAAVSAEGAGNVQHGDLLYLDTADKFLHSNATSLVAGRKVFAIYDDINNLAAVGTGLREITLDGISGFGSTATT